MNENVIELFVPGRLCLFGEHSDWAGLYRTLNADVEPGIAIVSGINEGIYATASCTDDACLIVRNTSDALKDGWEDLSTGISSDKLKRIAESDSFFAYIAGTASYVIQKYGVGGLALTITDMDMPIKSGLSSSAAICVLVARAYSKLYNLGLSVDEEMKAAYHGERATSSRCGRLDQAVAYGQVPVVMEFDSEDISARRLHVKTPLYWVFANLNDQKDTVQILQDLNDAYPYPRTETHKLVHEALGEDNQNIVQKAIEYIEEGKAEELGALMTEAQWIMDEKMLPQSEELRAPKLHQVLADPTAKSLSYGGKAVGSGGDGTVQFLAKGKAQQEELVEHLNSIGLEAFRFTIGNSAPIRKAIIPAAGYGTRMFPMSKALKKEFLPIVRNGIAKPAVQILLEELLEAGIEEICIIARTEGIQAYRDYFEQELSEDNYNKLPSHLKPVADKITEIGSKLEYRVMDDEVSFGYSVTAAADFAGSDPVLLCLSDQIYTSNTEISATSQFLQAYKELVSGNPEGNDTVLVSAQQIPVEEVSPYGILAGEWLDEGARSMKVAQFVEKPTVEYAKQNLTDVTQSDVAYAVFGAYIITPEVFKALPTTDFKLTEAIASLITSEKVFAYAPNAKMQDVGSPEAYRSAFAGSE